MWNGTVQNGVVVLESPGSIPDGTRVSIIPEANQPKKTPIEPQLASAVSSTGQMLLKHAGVTDQLPEDMARNHDYYLHGQPKR